ncbi:hypothetical protein C8P70_1234 [Myroides indicus]|uniref:Uncharacterized protein n=2 Tax=Myroides indicus TaxID=1323422 RepID=A0A4R7ER39_9FLAO|nr:hypothetical protein C8P70_1234 [Myroides indicus]
MRQGVITTGLNHLMHMAVPDNGYDEYGNKINDNGGDVMDIKYDSDGGILDITDVEVRYWEKVGETSPLPLEEFGIRRFRMASGAINQDNTFFELYAGGKILGSGLSYLSKEFTVLTGGLKQWIRTGSSYSIEGGFKTVSTRWGSGGNYWKKIGNPTLQNLNKSFRQTKLPGNSWRVKDAGHFHWWKK